MKTPRFPALPTIGPSTLIILFAIISQIVTGLLLLFGNNIGDVPRIELLVHIMHGNKGAGIVEIVTATFAVCNFFIHKRPIRKSLFLMPQQIVFLLSLESLLLALQASELGGVARPWEYIVLTQLYTFLIIIFHTIAVLLPAFQRNSR